MISVGDPAVISAVPGDIIQTHVLSRLDFLSLSSLSAASSSFHSLSSEDSLWKNLSHYTWPSTNHPRVLHLISQFPSCHRGFFSDCFPLIYLPHVQPRSNLSRPSRLISAVDIWYRNQLIFSRVLEADTGSGWFEYSPFRVDMLDPNEVVPTLIKIHDWDDDTWKEELEGNLTLSWIVIDPTRSRADNFSTRRPASVEKNWLTGEVRVEYGPVLGCNRVGLVVTCEGGREKGELYVREACLQVEDIDGNFLNGKDSLGILVEAMEFGKRKKLGENNKDEGMTMRKRHEDFMEMRRRRRERRVFRERMMDVISVSGISIFVGLSTSLLFGKQIISSL